MNKGLYPKLAFTNIKNNSKTYYPYLLTCISTIIMFYIMHSISINKGLDGVNGSQSLKLILNLGTWVIGIFSVIFLFYTNSFLIKRRKKELGLYNVLGLEKKHIAKILIYETLIISAISFVVGILGGIILNKLMFLLLLKLLAFKVEFGFTIETSSIVLTLIVFTGIFIVTLISNLFQIKVSNPAELLKGGQHGEKEPKAKWFIALTGLISLAIGYGIAITAENPIIAINFFFVAVILVMIGTYNLFVAGSIVILKLLRKNKRFYYKTKNFIGISGMMYRMKQNAVGLANICILSSAVLVMLSTTVSLYVGMEDILRYRFPQNIMMSTDDISTDTIEKINKIVDSEVEKSGEKIENKIDYRNSAIACINDNGNFTTVDFNGYNPSTVMLGVVPLSDYNRLEGENITLEDDEVIILSKQDKFGEENIKIQGKSFKVKKEINKVSFIESSPDIIKTYILIANNIDIIGDAAKTNYNIGVDVNASDEDIMNISNKLREAFTTEGVLVYVDAAAENREGFLSLYGGLFFLGIFLCLLFLMTTVLIIYYKQISEGYDDKERFNIMQKVGMSKEEIKKTIKNQVLMVFFLPLAFTIVHIAFAFPLITKLLAMLNLTNVKLFMIVTIISIIIFTVIYAIVYSVTARVYYKIVE